jgi:hypothetical protein
VDSEVEGVSEGDSDENTEGNTEGGIEGKSEGNTIGMALGPFVTIKSKTILIYPRLVRSAMIFSFVSKKPSKMQVVSLVHLTVISKLMEADCRDLENLSFSVSSSTAFRLRWHPPRRLGSDVTAVSCR